MRWSPCHVPSQRTCPLPCWDPFHVLAEALPRKPLTLPSPKPHPPTPASLPAAGGTPHQDHLSSPPGLGSACLWDQPDPDPRTHRHPSPVQPSSCEKVRDQSQDFWGSKRPPLPCHTYGQTEEDLVGSHLGPLPEPWALSTACDSGVRQEGGGPGWESQGPDGLGMLSVKSELASPHLVQPWAPQSIRSPQRNQRAWGGGEARGRARVLGVLSRAAAKSGREGGLQTWRAHPCPKASPSWHAHPRPHRLLP